MELSTPADLHVQLPIGKQAALLHECLRRSFAEMFQHTGARAVEAALHRSHGAAAYFGRFLVADAQDPDQHKDFAMMLRMRLDGFLDFPALDGPLLRGFRNRSL